MGFETIERVANPLGGGRLRRHLPVNDSSAEADFKARKPHAWAIWNLRGAGTSEFETSRANPCESRNARDLGLQAQGEPDTHRRNPRRDRSQLGAKPDHSTSRVRCAYAFTRHSPTPHWPFRNQSIAAKNRPGAV